MFGSLGFPELILIFVVALIVFGPKRLPEIGKTLGKALGEFKKATDDLKSSIEREVRIEELRQIPASMAMPPIDTVARVEPPPAPPEPPPLTPAPPTSPADPGARTE